MQPLRPELAHGWLPKRQHPSQCSLGLWRGKVSVGLAVAGEEVVEARFQPHARFVERQLRVPVFGECFSVRVVYAATRMSLQSDVEHLVKIHRG